jgi:hypothetical protein
MKCKYCGNALYPGERFCSECGAKAEPERAEPRREERDAYAMGRDDGSRRVNPWTGEEESNYGQARNYGGPADYDAGYGREFDRPSGRDARYQPGYGQSAAPSRYGEGRQSAGRGTYGENRQFAGRDSYAEDRQSADSRRYGETYGGRRQAGYGADDDYEPVRTAARPVERQFDRQFDRQETYRGNQQFNRQGNDQRGYGQDWQFDRAAIDRGTDRRSDDRYAYDMSRQGGYPSDNNPERDTVRQGGYSQNQPSSRGQRYPEGFDRGRQAQRRNYTDDYLEVGRPPRRDYTDDYIDIGQPSRQGNRQTDGGNGYIADYVSDYADDYDKEERRSAIPFRRNRHQAQNPQAGQGRSTERRLTFEDIFQGSDDDTNGEDGESSHPRTERKEW